jgi:hypothetical protein
MKSLILSVHVEIEHFSHINLIWCKPKDKGRKIQQNIYSGNISIGMYCHNEA